MSLHKEYPKEYNSWRGAKKRCYNENNTSYKYYGGRGIQVCDRWLNSFENFLTDMGEKPSSSHSLDRINNDGDYSPDNCRWATSKEQSSNKRPIKLDSYDVRVIKLLLDKGCSHSYIASLFDVTKQHISEINLNTKWQEVTYNDNSFRTSRHLTAERVIQP